MAMPKQQPLHTNSKTSQQQNIIRQGLQHDKAPWEARRDVNLETPDDIIDHRVSQNVKLNITMIKRVDLRISPPDHC
jgi:hypothetical protein